MSEVPKSKQMQTVLSQYWRKLHELPDRFISIIHRERDSGAFKVVDLVLNFFGPIGGNEFDLQLASSRHNKVSGFVLKEAFTYDTA